MAYLTVEEYVGRFGEYETRIFTITDDVQPPPASYDSARVSVALSDATEEVDGYISARYATPLESPPTVAKGWVAAIARLKLAEGTGRVSETIKDAAARATRQLEMLVAGKLNLPVPEGGEAPSAISNGDPLTSNDRDCPVFGGGRLDAFTATFTGACDVPNWRRGG